MLVYVITCENYKSHEKYVECVFRNEEDAINYINNTNKNTYNDYIYDYCVFELK